MHEWLSNNPYYKTDEYFECNKSMKSQMSIITTHSWVKLNVKQ